MKSGMKRTFSIVGALCATPLLLAAVIGAVCMVGCDGGGGGTVPWTDPNNPGGNPGTNPGTPGGNTPGKNTVKYDTLIDDRDGRAYKTVKIGNQTWMAENLDANISGSWCYGNDTSNCKRYGRLYNWEMAMESCPSGWHLPAGEEWDELVAYAGGAEKAGKKLKAGGTDDFGFSALMGGAYFRFSEIISAFGTIGLEGIWWTASLTEAEKNSIYASARGIESSKDIVYIHSMDSDEAPASRASGLSVRCVMDESGSVSPPAVYYSVTVSSVGEGAFAAGVAVIYRVGSGVSIYAGKAPVGQRFKNWTVTSGGVTLAAADSVQTTFTMPANAVKVTANFETVSVETGTITDARDGQTYKTVKIGGGNTWMAQNLNYQTPDSSWCYGDSAANCVKYGRLYAWNAAMSACPTGWHLSTKGEWEDLRTTVGVTDASKRLKAKSGWKLQYESDVGTDDYGFSALPGGYCNIYDNIISYYSIGTEAEWWTATLVERLDDARARTAYYATLGTLGYTGAIMVPHSVRCVQDN
jgi:uncharacterized protein (TIGR02145 family)